jgi:GT2 family glycosyltransferase
MKKITIAVLMTCHNRRDQTLACLAALAQQTLQPEYAITVHLVDDGSADGTGLAVHTNYPQVKVIQGTGQLFWNGGMHLAFADAMQVGYDYYLWLNDDTILYPNALASLLAVSQQLHDQGHLDAVVVAAVQDPQSGQLSYGGLGRSSRWHPLKFALIPPSRSPQPCLTFNGNCVLIPRSVTSVVGNLDPSFIHSTGDIDYGLRVSRQYQSAWLAPGFFGSCAYNPLRHQAWEVPGLTLQERWHKINQPLGLPIREWKVFARRHAGVLWRIYWLLPYARLFKMALVNSWKPQHPKPI